MQIKEAFCQRQGACSSALFQQCAGHKYSHDQWILLKMRAKRASAVTIRPFNHEWAGALLRRLLYNFVIYLIYHCRYNAGTSW